MSGGTYRVVTTGTPKRVERRQNTTAWVIGGAIGIASAVIGRLVSGVALTVALVAVAVAVAYVLSRWFIAPVSPHLVLDPEEHEQLDALLARGAGPAAAELRSALADGRLDATQIGQLRDLVRAEEDRLWAVIDDKATETPDGMLDDWAILRDVRKRLKRIRA